ncbi:SMC family ATPase [Cryobacterium levicorallinum]|uniref:Nuclease SbcCD subunit C n=1 Tax=Cryobacterium levicorallinum TaxID=995038 RepID=A0A1I3CF69_9MICO|nr:SMC family ATPase [Cryobacterium levicorallinum]TFB88801.1 SMC family ATPase [Cryobacterium levicorallinum]GEP27706.1 nuclease SbcCD subunit C [Cryobacterium levicorallinum]SFH73180.1 exonuclease SbcC [Cryobacterium levicorallinum]
MKILRLRLAGFGPYKDEQLVDFERFDSDGIFLISGKTGAGKSSILDAICFALYNQVPRFDGSELKLRSDHCEAGDPTFVELDFSVNQSRYRLRRSPAYERPKKNQVGVTTAAPTAVLQVLDDADGSYNGGWRGIAAKPGAVGHELDTILPLKVDQFLQVILLAQNRFQRFLLAKTEERRAVLRTLFNTGRFEQLEAALILRRKGLDEQLATSQRDLEQDQTAAAQLLRDEGPLAAPTAGWFAAAQHDLAGQLDAATIEQARTMAELTAATDRHQSLLQTEQRQLRRSAAASALASLDSRQDDIVRERSDLQNAARAARVWPQVRARHEAASALAAAESALAAAQAQRTGDRPAETAGAGAAGRSRSDVASPETLGQLQLVIDGLLGRLGALEDALADELALPELDNEIAELLIEQLEGTRALDAARAQADALPEQIEAITAEHSAAQLAAARQSDTMIALDRATLTLEAAQTVTRLSSVLLTAQQAELTASGDNADAAAHYESVLARRFSGFAAELAARLVTGDACAVCGSTAHPQPALGHDDPVTTHDLNTARSTVTDRQSQLLVAQNAVQSVNLRLAEARALTSGRDAATVTAEHDAATAAHRLADRATATLPDLQARLAQLQSTMTRAATSVDQLRGQRDQASTAHAFKVSQREAIFGRLAAQRGEFDSVRGQATHLHDELTQARTLATALSVVDECGAAEDAAQSRLTAQLAEEAFTDEAAALAARLDQPEIERRTRALRVHDDGLAAARATLAQPDLADLPTEPVDVLPAAAAAAAASTARDAALTRQSSLVDRTGTLSAIVRRVGSLFAASAQLHEMQQQVRQLADVVHGDEPNTKRMRLENYVLAAQLEEIVAAANIRLRTMTSGRYTLEHDDSLAFGGARSGLGLAIRDEYTGRARPTHSLSGGETFLASLALALGLAEVVTGQAGGVTLDTLFVDEGFGSLDGETLETAMSTLDSLRAGGRTIGLISHVDSMKEQIPATLRIVVTDRGSSEIEGGDATG